jgi:hypothetical protein
MIGATQGTDLSASFSLQARVLGTSIPSVGESSVEKSLVCVCVES